MAFRLSRQASLPVIKGPLTDQPQFLVANLRMEIWIVAVRSIDWHG